MLVRIAFDSSNPDTKVKSRNSKYCSCFFGPSVEIRLRPRPGMDADKCVAAVETGGKRRSYASHLIFESRHK